MKDEYITNKTSIENKLEELENKYNELINVLKQLEQDSTELPYINNIIKQALKNEKN